MKDCVQTIVRLRKRDELVLRGKEQKIGIVSREEHGGTFLIDYHASALPHHWASSRVKGL